MKLLIENKVLMSEWNHEKNTDLNLQSLKLGSHVKVWWKCSKGHEWQACICNRANGTGCPYCSGHKVILGKNDLVTLYPDIAKEWNYERNKDLKPSQVSSKSNKKVWWKCSRGHEWQLRICDRVKNLGCPYCSGRYVLKGENDLVTLYPNVAKEWNYERNKGLEPNQISAKANKKVWWKCSKGHEWQAYICNRTRGAKCPYCSGKYVIKGENDLATLYPDLAKEWNYKKNENLKPENFMAGSHKKVWWKCFKGHEWQANIYSRVSGIGCPYCSGRYVIKGENDFKKTHPELMKEWNYERNKDISPDEILSAVNKKVWWKCSKGHEWQASINNRHKGTGCPICSSEIQTSYPEQIINFYLSQQIPVENRYKFEGKEIDIFIPSLLVGIEYDGIYYHNTNKSFKKERTKDMFLKEKGIKIIRIKEATSNHYDKKKDIIYYKPRYNYENLDEVLKIVFEILNLRYNTQLKLNFDLKRDNTKILTFVKTLEKKKSLAFCNKALLKEWNYEKNKNLNPEFFDIGSGYKVWWKCSKGHEWQASIDSRNRGTGCPICANQKLLIGYNDLATLYPNIAKEWNYEKNKGLKPENVLAGSTQKYWWKCSKGHEWKISVSRRVCGNNCPICANKQVLKGYNDLKTWCINNNRKYLIDEFDYEKNNFQIDEITSGSSKKVWWKCPNGHSYQTFLTHRTRMFTGCPYCSNKKLLAGYNDLATTHPEIAEEWDYNKNYPITPSDVMAGSNNRKYWFLCKNGHSYESTLLNRKRVGKCPKCK